MCIHLNGEAVFIYNVFNDTFIWGEAVFIYNVFNDTCITLQCYNTCYNYKLCIVLASSILNIFNLNIVIFENDQYRRNIAVIILDHSRSF